MADVKILMVDDEWTRVSSHFNALCYRFGDENLEYYKNIEELKSQLKVHQAAGTLGDVRIVLDIMFGLKGNMDGLDFLIDDDWGPLLIKNKIRIIVLTNMSLAEVKHGILPPHLFKDTVTGNWLCYSQDIVKICDKEEYVLPRRLVDLAEKLFL